MTATLRDRFLLDPDLVFLNHGSFGALPREVMQAWQALQVQAERNPVAFLARESGARLHQAREALAGYLGTEAESLAFVTNATTGVHVAAQTLLRALPLQAGDEVLATDHEYGACDAIWQQACAQAGAVYRRLVLPLPYRREEVLPRLEAAITARTRVLFASHITSATALVLPVRALCAAARQRGIVSVIDGAHAPGQLALDLSAVDADIYVGNAHKWLCAPRGSAFISVRGAWRARVAAPMAGWGDVADAVGPGSPLDAYTGTDALQRRLQWLGTRDLCAFLAVPAAIEFHRRHLGPAQRLRAHALACSARARVLAASGLPVPVPDEDHAQMVIIPVRLPTGWRPEQLQAWLLSEHRIELPVTVHPAAAATPAGGVFVRLSIQAYNTEAEVQRLVQALAAVPA
jgi:isopenicillin-N epimerase